MPETPVWLQEIHERADKATPGPWGTDKAAPYERFSFYIPEIMSPPEMRQYDGLTEEDAAFCAHARTDIPRLIGLVEEMAATVQALVDMQCKRMGCTSCNNTECLSKLWGQAYEVLAKYRGEVDKP
jgi:hypothetical protein